MRECVDIVLAAFRDGRVNHRGKHWVFEDVEVLPKPVQRPHPPVWLAASSPEAVQRAAESGFSILMDPHASHAEIGRKHALYRETLAAHGHSYAGREIPIARMLAVAPTDDAALAVARAGAQWTLGYAKIPGLPADPNAAVDRYVSDVVIHGSPERVVEQIQITPREHRPRLPDVRAALARVVHALHRTRPTEAGLVETTRLRRTRDGRRPRTPAAAPRKRRAASRAASRRRA